ncbi:acetate--CoA ligase family protein [Novosphingobium sp. MMS21-SN21R]|uniref:acetate--CoA ligase family protein n=1 Tax=Novosphingobium sp. MMS21-SN21R TaxID=2969298 RepID=UPI0028881EFE|nr:acetate--CoA ligase family protein [Novosphingobium sp. MMS21-SN21R]MDT0509766.1 acetate--CoA ligase family protein [Novosphingobium sp. MMS21-SN21R]
MTGGEGLSAALDRLFSATDIALIGASDRSTWSHMIVRRFRDFGHQGQLHAVNREGKSAHGLPGYRSCRDIADPVQAAIIFVPAQAVASAMEDAADAGITSMVVLSSGFAEAGAQGEALQRELVATAHRRGVTFFGPNSLGFANIASGAVATAIGTRVPVIKGGIAIVSQSGAVANEIAKFAHQQGIGLSFVCATGNEAMVGLADVVDYLVDDPATRVITAYVESVGDTERLRKAARRALVARKPIVLIKVGSSPVSAQVARAHTGALVGDDRVFDAACHELGLIRVRSIEEMMVTAALVDASGPLERPGIALASVSGGGCGMFADLAQQHGVPIPPFSPATCVKLRQLLPSFAASLNPLDMTGAVLQDPSLWARALPILFDDPGIGLVVTLIAMPGTQPEMATCEAHWPVIAKAYRDAGKRPLLITQVIQPMGPEAQQVAQASGLTDIIFGMDFGARALGHLARWSSRIAASMAEPEPAAPLQPIPRPIGERAALEHLSLHGVPVVPGVVVTSGADAAAAVQALGGKAALKIASAQIEHKTEVGGVQLGITPDNAARAFTEICADVARARPDAQCDGVIVSPMRSGGLELFVGITRDPDWGLAISVGLGGVWIELLNDSVVRLLPITDADAQDMLRSLRAARLFDGYRGASAIDTAKLAEAIVGIANAAIALGPSLAVLEINPLWVRGSSVEAFDALIVWEERHTEPDFLEY